MADRSQLPALLSRAAMHFPAGIAVKNLGRKSKARLSQLCSDSMSISGTRFIAARWALLGQLHVLDE